MLKYASSIKPGDRLAADTFFDIRECRVDAVVREGWLVRLMTTDRFYPDGYLLRPFDKVCMK